MKRIDVVRRRIMQVAYDLADEGNSEGYNSVKVMCSEVLNMVEDIIKEEREACAKVCDDIDAEYEGEDVSGNWCSRAIRARGEQK